MCDETIQPPETNAQYLGLGLSLLGAKFVRGGVCQGPRCPGIRQMGDVIITSGSSNP